jgi:hypothetical protein
MHPEAQDQSSRPVQSTTQPNPIMEANERNGTEPATETGGTRARGSGLYGMGPTAGAVVLAVGTVPFPHRT